MPKILFREWKNKLQTSRKYLQMRCLTKDLYPEYNSKFHSKKTNNQKKQIGDLNIHVPQRGYEDGKYPHEKTLHIISR